MPIFGGGNGFYDNLPYKINFSYSSNIHAATPSKVVLRKPAYVSLNSTTTAYPYTIYPDSIVFRVNGTGNQFTDSIAFVLSSYEFSAGHDISSTATLYIDSSSTNSFVKLAKDSLIQYNEGGFNLAGPGIPILTYQDTMPDNLKSWYRSFGGSNVDSATGVIALDDSSSVLIGNSRSLNADLNTVTDTTSSFVVKYNNDGGMLWKNILTGEKLDKLLYVKALPNGDILTLGEATSVTGSFSGNHGMKDLWLTKIAANGSILWQKLLGGSNDETAAGLKLSKSNEVYIAAHTFSNDGTATGVTGTASHLWLLKLDASGNILNQKVFNDSLDIYNYNAFEILDNGELVVVASGKSLNTNSNVIIENAYTVKLDSNFNLINLIRVNHGVMFNTRINAIAKTKNGGYGLVGAAWPSNYYADFSAPYYAQYLGGNMDMVFYSVGNGGITERILYGGDYEDEGFDLVAINDTFYVGGKTSGLANVGYYYDEVIGYHYSPDGVRRSDGWVIKLDTRINYGFTGDITTQKTFGGIGSDEITSLAVNRDKSLLIAGNTNSYNNGDVYDSKGATDAFLVKYSALNTVSGTVFIDANNNNIYDAGETLYHGSIVKTTGSTTSWVSDIMNGHYYNQADTGKFVTKPELTNSYYTSVPVADTVIFRKFLENKVVDFALHPVAAVKDVKITIFPLNNTRPGNETNYEIAVENKGTTTIPAGNIKMIKDSRTAFISAQPTQNNLSADTITWTYANLKPLDVMRFYAKVKLDVPPVLNNGDTLKVYGTVTPIAGDTTPLNNACTVAQLVSSSIDPNDKSETHLGKLSAQQLTDGEYLTYVIRFQNTGNDTAFRVTVRDTLDNKLDWNSIQMIGSSHPYTMIVKNGNYMEWKFDPIYLPDSNINEPGSHGYLAFRIKAKSNIVAGDIIKNNAAIYFDFNTPVATNTVVTIFGTSAPLPVTLISFYGVEKNKTAVLSWQTSSEINTKYFEVEKSTNGIDFITLEKVIAKGNTAGINNYSVNDPKPRAGYNYYRLKIFDTNSQYRYSQVVVVNISNTPGLLISPNPAGSVATIAINGELNGYVTINLVDMKGSIVKKIYQGNVNTNSFTTSLNVNTLRKGLYFIEVLQGDIKLSVQKLVIQ